MPQMGESITEGTVSKWLKAVGDTIEKDEPLLEISTDKVDAEVPSPAAGKLLAINVNEGETVEVGAVVGLVGAEGSSGVQSPKSNVQSSSSAVEQKTAATSASAGSSTETVSMPTEEKQAIEETEGRSYDYQRPEAKDDRKKQRQIKRRIIARRFAPHEIFAACPQYRQRTRRRYFAASKAPA